MKAFDRDSDLLSILTDSIDVLFLLACEFLFSSNFISFNFDSNIFDLKNRIRNNKIIMAGRGGFKGPSTSLRPEQLQGMGIIGKDMPSSIVAPPPTYPPLLSRQINNF